VPPRRKTGRNILLALLAIAILTAGGAYLVWRMTRSAFDSVVSHALEKKEEVVDISALVTQVRELNRLETASMRVIHVSTITQTYEMVPDSLAGDELTFLAAGDVIAGVDMSLLKREDVWKQPDGTIVMRLPPSQILVSRVDNKESRVLTRKTGILRRADINLESRARQRAEQEIRNEAMRKGILKLADGNAQTHLAQFLHTMGFQKVSFAGPNIRPPQPKG
jgi:hypothetical protein